MQNAYYGSLADYVNAVAEALRTEYEAIVAQRDGAADRWP